MTSHPRLALATTANLTGALPCDMLVPERRLPVECPGRDDTPALARKLEIFADRESLDTVAPLVIELGFAFASDAATSPRLLLQLWVPTVSGAVARTISWSGYSWDVRLPGTGEAGA